MEIAVAGAGSTNVKATVAVNLSVAFASLGMSVELLDGDAERHASRALTGGEAAERVRLIRGGAMRVDAIPVGREPREPAAEVTVIDCAPRVDGEVVARLVAATLVLIPVDGSPVSLRALEDVAAAVAGSSRPDEAPRARVLLSRSLPRSVDRWALVDRLNERDDTTLHPTTMPMARARRRDGPGATAGRRRDATLYAPGTSAAKAYASLAREILREAGARRTRRDA
jgi:cellulose biosynthesis protein BcsQ